MQGSFALEEWEGIWPGTAEEEKCHAVLTQWSWHKGTISGSPTARGGFRLFTVNTEERTQVLRQTVEAVGGDLFLCSRSSVDNKQGL